MISVEMVAVESVSTYAHENLVRRVAPCRRLSDLAAAAATLAAGLSLLLPDLLVGVPVMNGNLRGTALVTLLVVPVLVVSARLGGRDARGTVVWLGSLAYLLYQGVMFSFATPMNRAFLAYVALLGSAGWALAALVRAVDPVAVGRGLGLRFPARVLASVLGVAAAINLLAWLVQVAPVVWTGHSPAVVVQSGMPTAVTWVQDLAFWLPLSLVVAASTWRGRATQAWLGGLLVFSTLEALGVASDQWWGTRADASHPALASGTAAVGALMVAAALGGLCWWALRRPEQSRSVVGRAHEIPRASAAVRRALVTTSALTSVAALAGAVQLVTGTYTPPVSDLEPLRLDSWVLPGVWLALSVALPCAATGVTAWRRQPSAGKWGTASGLLLLVELGVQIPFVGLDPLQAVMGVVALVLVWLGRAAS